MNGALLIATIGSGMASQLDATRLLFAMGQDGALPRRFFGTLNPVRRIPQNNVPLIGAIVLVEALVMSYELGTELLNYGASRLHGRQRCFRSSSLACEGLEPLAPDSALQFWLRSVLLSVAESWPNCTMGRDCVGGTGNRFMLVHRNQMAEDKQLTSPS
jgi:hypothetical protein